MRSGNGAWRQHSKNSRPEAIKEALRLGVAERSPKSARLFGAVIKNSAVEGQDPVELAFKQLISRCDLFLKRIDCQSKRLAPQLGLILLDKSSIENRIQTLAREFR